jgi:hypothetical protein
MEMAQQPFLTGLVTEQFCDWKYHVLIVSHSAQSLHMSEVVIQPQFVVERIQQPLMGNRIQACISQ